MHCKVKDVAKNVYIALVPCRSPLGFFTIFVTLLLNFSMSPPRGRSRPEVEVEVEVVVGLNPFLQQYRIIPGVQRTGWRCWSRRRSPQAWHR